MVFYDNHYKVCFENTEQIYSYNNELKATYNDLPIHPFYNESYATNERMFVVSNGDKCAIYKNDALQTPFLYDNILPSGTQLDVGNTKVEVGLKVGVINANGGYLLRPNYSNVVNQKNNYFVVEQNGGFGIVKLGDTLVLDFVYNYIKIQNQYAILSKNGKQFGVYNLETNTQTIPYKYDNFSVSKHHILAKRDDYVYDVFHNDSLKIIGLTQVNASNTIIKGYKDSQVYIAYCDTTSWEVSVYNVPIYKTKTMPDKHVKIKAFSPLGSKGTYDYKTGKWGIYNYTHHTWKVLPQTHSGDYVNSTRLLNFYSDTLLQWEGINFKAIKRMPLLHGSIKDTNFWIDNKNASYSLSNTTISSVSTGNTYYTLPGKGNAALPNTVNGNVNAQIENVILVDGTAFISQNGELLLSEYLCGITLQGGAHPNAISDYEKTIDISNFVTFENHKEYLVKQAPFLKKDWIKITQPFEWIEKEVAKKYLFKANGMYGLIADTATVLIAPKYDTLFFKNKHYIAGIPKNIYQLYDTAHHKKLSQISNITQFSESIVVTENELGEKTLYNKQLQIITSTWNQVQLLGANEYAIYDQNQCLVYQDTLLLFEHNYPFFERRNKSFFEMRSNTQLEVRDSNGSVLFLADAPFPNIRFTPSFFIVKNKSNYEVFDTKGKQLYQFASSKYILLSKGAVLIEEAKKLCLITSQGRVHHFTGKLLDHKEAYFVLDTDKNKIVYDYDGLPIINKLEKIWTLNNRFFTCQRSKKLYLYDIKNASKIEINTIDVELNNKQLTYLDKKNQEVVIQLDTKPHSGWVIVSYKNKKGLYNNNEQKLPISYNDIKPFGAYCLIQSQLEYSVLDAKTFEPASPILYDTIVSLPNHIAALKNGVWYYY